MAGVKVGSGRPRRPRRRSRRQTSQRVVVIKYVRAFIRGTVFSVQLSAYWLRGWFVMLSLAGGLGVAHCFGLNYKHIAAIASGFTPALNPAFIIHALFSLRQAPAC